jgi:hypothetical protein
LPEHGLRPTRDHSVGSEMPEQEKPPAPKQEDEDIIAARLRNLGYID